STFCLQSRRIDGVDQAVIITDVDDAAELVKDRHANRASDGVGGRAAVGNAHFIEIAVAAPQVNVSTTIGKNWLAGISDGFVATTKVPSGIGIPAGAIVHYAPEVAGRGRHVEHGVLNPRRAGECAAAVEHRVPLGAAVA